MLVYPLSPTEERIVRWTGRLITVVSVLAILTLALLSLELR